MGHAGDVDGTDEGSTRLETCRAQAWGPELILGQIIVDEAF